MRLLQYTTRYFLVLIISLLFLLSLALYFSVSYTVYNDVDEYLMGRKHVILKSIAQNPDIVNEKPVYHSDFEIKKISPKEFDKFQKKNKSQKFKDTQKYDEIEEEDEPFRKIESVFESNGQYYKLTVIASLLNSEELLFAILINILLFAVLLVLLSVVLNRVLLQKVWKPFHANLGRIKQYKLDKDTHVDFEDSNITEFKEFNQTIQELIQNNVKAYKSQKQFIENASHEMQTPLGVMQGKIDLLMETSALNDQQAHLTDALAEQVNRLSRLNKTLLLLSKIENKQFVENETIDVSMLIKGCCEDFSELIEFKELRLNIVVANPCSLSMHPDLARMLFANLIKNAINHNIASGFIIIQIEQDKITFVNSGRELQVPPEIVFERFYKNSPNPQSTGLGLAIVKTIADLYHFKATYQYKEHSHIFSVIF